MHSPKVQVNESWAIGLDDGFNGFEILLVIGTKERLGVGAGEKGGILVNTTKSGQIVIVWAKVRLEDVKQSFFMD